MPRTLIIEDEENLRFSIKRTLSKAGHEVYEAACLRDARQHVAQRDFDLVITDVILGSENGIDMVRDLRAEGFDGVIVVMTAHGTVESAVGAMREGADDYLQKPLSMEELSIQAERWLEHRRLAKRVLLYERLQRARENEDELLGKSEPWRQTLVLASRLASIPLESAESRNAAQAAAATGVRPSSSPGGSLPCILLLGETGAGKGVVARFIHQQAGELLPRRTSKGSTDLPPFVHVNCSALPTNLVESELFGHEKGAFTDASEARAGLFEMADGGTIFLDEISEMPIELQAKLLIVVERGVFRRVGGTKERVVRVRVIAASNQNLDERAQAGGFRRDLLYRLNAFTVSIPPLRDRENDAVVIAAATLERLCRRFGRPRMVLTGEAEKAIREHPWPGNVRELVNVIQRAVMLSDRTKLEPSDFGLVFPHGAAHNSGGDQSGAGRLVFDFERGPHSADEVEKALIMQALEHEKGNVSRAAKLIGLQRSSLRYRIERYHLEQYVTEVAKK